jgi:hypothetical protein
MRHGQGNLFTDLSRTQVQAERLHLGLQNRQLSHRSFRPMRGPALRPRLQARQGGLQAKVA